MSKFKKGDKVRVDNVSGAYGLCYGEICEVSGYNDGHVQVNGLHFGYREDRFSLVERDANKAKEINATSPNEDMVNSPTHYTSDPSGVECLTIVRHRNFNVGNAIKYLWRNGLKKDSDLQDSAKQVEDLEKAVFYIKDEIERLKTLQ